MLAHIGFVLFAIAAFRYLVYLLQIQENIRQQCRSYDIVRESYGKEKGRD